MPSLTPFFAGSAAWPGSRRRPTAAEAAVNAAEARKVRRCSFIEADLIQLIPDSGVGIHKKPCTPGLLHGNGQNVAQASRLRVLAASRRQKRKNYRARRPVNSQARTPGEDACATLSTALVGRVGHSSVLRLVLRTQPRSGGCVMRP